MTTEYHNSSGNLSSETEPDFKVSFLYNGQLGVMTDDNGLYYMRARYYNPDIKRFINQDILTGNIGNSASLNRYSYVQGNPVSYTDPFGLEPFSYFTDKVKPSVIAHTVLDVLGCLPGGSAFDLMNATLYALEGNYTEAIKSLVFSIPGMDLGGKAGKYLMKGTKAGKALGTTFNVIDKTGKALAIGMSAYDFGNQVAFMIDKYMVNGEDISWDTAYEVLALGASGFQLSQFTKMGVSSFDTPKKSSGADVSGSTKYGVVDNSQIGNVTYEGHVVDYNDLPGGDKFNAASDKGGFSSGGCFTAGTKVKTPYGEKNIEDIEVGDEVCAYNPDTEEKDVKKVLQIFVHESDKIAHVTIDGETIDATTNHPFYVVGYSFIQAGELKAGDIILQLDGTTREVEAVSIEYLEQPVKVYNFGVDDWHTYYVGKQGVLVHNQCQATEVPKTSYGKSSDNLNWDNVIGKKGETRVEHVKLHESNDLTKAEHGVFYGEAKNTIEKAWENRTNGYMITSGNKDIYIIPYENVGYAGGYGGQGNNLNYITIITQKGTNNIITGFPGNGYKYTIDGLIGGN